ncbi:Bax inhibitor-1/YccA family protein [Desulfospira joergensenii]|uniref:Bax inhibitor-1/YccA family protein n=1 Tax=Desulfospira joergensenii TaxID=53329 RepID=UPI0003B760CB|nr:Bax inhibitor-1/YccA family protein [Desulfospira joergensenii]
MNTNFSTSQYAGTASRVNAFIRSTYNWMAVGLALTGVTSYFVSTSPAILQMVYGNPIMPFAMMIGLVILCGFLGARINKMQASTATGLYALLTVLYGVCLAPIFLVYTSSSIASTFFICAATFGAASVYGMVTKKDLTGMAQFMMMGLIGIIIAMVVNIFIGSTMMQMIISMIAVVIFTGLTAYDTQKLKSMAVTMPDNATGAMVRKGAIMGALSLYLDFMGLFVHLLHLLGVARD